MHVPGSLLVVMGCMLAAGGLASFYAVRATSWAVMTDELQVARLATSIADDLSPVPRIHGVYYGALSQLYPLLLAPFYGFLSAPAAETAGHVLNAILLASAAVPAFLLARSVTGSSPAGWIAAAFAVFTPWLALASTLLTENAAYPAFVWALFLCHRAVAAPSAGRDVAALAGLFLAFFARTQLLVLALAFPVALVLHEVGFAVANRRGSARAAVSSGARRAMTAHRMLAAFYLMGALGSAALALRRSLGTVVGNYATPFAGDLLPVGFWRSAAAHFDQVAVGVGVLPVVLAVSWTVTTFARPARKEGHAFAALLVVLVPFLTFEATSFDLRFTPEQFVQDRYLVYLVPLFGVGSAAWLVQRTERSLRLVSLVAAGSGLVALLGYATYDDRTIIFWASPAAAFHPALETVAGPLGLSTSAFLRVATVILVLALVLAARMVPKSAMVVTVVAVAGFGAIEAAYVLHRYGDPFMTRPPRSAVRDWIDLAVPSGHSVALVPSPGDAPASWWEAEFWNKSADRVLRVDSRATFTPFPADDVSVDYWSGTIRGPQPTEYLVLSARESRFHLAGESQVANADGLRLVHVPRPYRLSWVTFGLTTDGWTRPLGLTTIRLFADRRPLRRTVVVTLAAPASARAPIDFVLRGGSTVVYGLVDPGGARPPVGLDVCVPAHGYVDVTLVTHGVAPIEDGRLVSLHLDRLRIHGAHPCRPSPVAPSHE
jgi:hypothetical protein